jgi:hypothetical protein
MKISVTVEALDERGLTNCAKLCGWTLARSHARSGSPAMIVGYMGNSGVFDRAIEKFALDYADQTERDHKALARAVRDGRLKAEEVKRPGRRATEKTTAGGRGTRVGRGSHRIKALINLGCPLSKRAKMRPASALPPISAPANLATARSALCKLPDQERDGREVPRMSPTSAVSESLLVCLQITRFS